MGKLNSRLKTQYKLTNGNDANPIGLAVTIRRTKGVHDEYLSFLDLLTWSRKRLPSNDKSTYKEIYQKIIDRWNEDPKNVKDQRKIINFYEVYEAKFYVKIKM